MSDKNRQVMIRICCMIIIPLVSIIHVALNTYRENMHNISIILDDWIPFVPAFSIPYLYWFLYVFAGLLYFAIMDGKYYFRLLGSIVVGMCLSFVFFYFYPTTVVRPEILGNGLMERSVAYIYSMDNPYNCFPSIHVLNAMLVTMFLCSYRKSLRVWGVSIFSCAAIILSTLFVKQHYVLDAVGGIILSTGVYLFFMNENFWNSIPMQRVMALFTHPRPGNDPNI